MNFSHKRVDFSKDRYEKYDTIGKKLGYALLNHSYKHNPKYKIQPILENKTCGDISVLNLENNTLKWYEIEVRSSKYFQLNFEKHFDSLDIPVKKFHLIKDGTYLVFDESEEMNNLPQRFMSIKINDIIEIEPIPKRTKFNNQKDEYFYKVPYQKVKFCRFNLEKNKYDVERI